MKEWIVTLCWKQIWKFEISWLENEDAVRQDNQTCHM